MTFVTTFKKNKKKDTWKFVDRNGNVVPLPLHGGCNGNEEELQIWINTINQIINPLNTQKLWVRNLSSNRTQTLDPAHAASTSPRRSTTRSSWSRMWSSRRRMRTAWSLRKQRREVSNEERNAQMDRSDHRFHRHSPADGIRNDLLRRSMLNKVKALPGIMLGRAFNLYNFYLFNCNTIYNFNGVCVSGTRQTSLLYNCPLKGFWPRIPKMRRRSPVRNLCVSFLKYADSRLSQSQFSTMRHTSCPFCSVVNYWRRK